MHHDETRALSWSKPAAVVEVVLVFALLHVSYRAIKHFTAWGQFEGTLGLNLTPGLAMIAFTFGAVWLHRRPFRSYGLTLADWQRHLSLVLFCITGAAVIAGPPLLLASRYYNPMRAPSGTQAILGTLANLAAALLLLIVMRRDRSFVTGWPPIVTLPLVAAIAASPVIVAAWRHKPVESAALEALWLFVGAGFGEEVFFRGYVQSHVDLAFGRTWSLFGTPLGPGILMSAALFGMIHVLNPVDYFQGRFNFAWWWFPREFAAGLVMGCIRSRTGSVLPCAVIHGLGDIIGTLPRWLS
jgi:membrane protease YdiL (CAAX protease family)